MKVAFLDLKRIYRLTEHDVDREIRHVLESGHYILGSHCQKFEEELRDSLDPSGHAIGCNSGTDALVLPLLTLGIGSDDQVIVPSHTAIPTVTAIRATGATPVFCDIDPKTWLLDIESISALLTSKTKAIIAVHLYGNLVDIHSLRKTLDQAGRADIKIVEDVAQAHGSTWTSDGVAHQAGTIGDFGSFSFYPTKNLGALGDAGGVFTKNAEWAEKMRMLRFYGQKDRYNALIDRGVNSRLDELQAAILLARLKYMDRWQRKKHDMVVAYRSVLNETKLRYQAVSETCQPNWHLFVVQAESKAKRDEWQSCLEGHGVQTLIHYPIPTHRQKAFAKYATQALPVTEHVAETIFSLPMNVAMTQEEVAHVLESIKKVCYRN